MRRVTLVLTDGLRPDAITPTRMPSLYGLASEFTLALRATTVRPSTTVAALATLATGLSPKSHRLIEPGLGFLSRLGELRPLARELGRAGVLSHLVTSELSPMEHSAVRALSAAAGVGHLTSQGPRAREVARAALNALAESGFVFAYLSDCDRAGHAYGWMSREYLDAAAEVDAAIGLLSRVTEDSLIIVLADHGGGGVTPTSHHEPHPVNDRIPLVLAGLGVTRRHQVTRPVSILDVPPTVCRSLGVPVPESYEGRALAEAFIAPEPAAEVGA